MSEFHSVDAQVFEQKPFCRSPITARLVDGLRQLKPGETITYEQLEEMATIPVQGSHHLKTARDILLKDPYSPVVFTTVRGVGLYRLKNDEIPSFSNQYHKMRLKNDTKRYRAKLETVDVAKLQGSDRQELLTGKSILMLREAIASKPIEAQIRSSQGKDLEELVDTKKVMSALKALWK